MVYGDPLGCLFVVSAEFVLVFCDMRSDLFRRRCSAFTVYCRLNLRNRLSVVEPCEQTLFLPGSLEFQGRNEVQIFGVLVKSERYGFLRNQLVGDRGLSTVAELVQVEFRTCFSAWKKCLG